MTALCCLLTLLIILQMLVFFARFFFFQAEDGIRDDLVTGVQTCALPIFPTQSSLRQYSLNFLEANTMPIHEFVVEELKSRLDKFLASQLPQVSRSQIQKDIESGMVDVNEQMIAESKFLVRLNDKVVYREL